MPRRPQAPSLAPEQAIKLYPEKLADAQEQLSSHGIEYRILGSIAASTYIDDGTPTINFARENAFEPHQRVPDVDLLVPRDALTQAKLLQKKFRQDTELPVNLEFLSAQHYVDFCPRAEKSFLTHRKLSVPFLTEVLAPVEREFLGVPITTVDPNTLFHTYVTFGGLMRSKDWPKALSLARYIRDQGSAFPESAYAPFHRYIADRSYYYHNYGRSRKAAYFLHARVPSFVQHAGVSAVQQVRAALRERKQPHSMNIEAWRALHNPNK